MADIDLKSATPDTSLPTDGFLFGADSQSAASPSVYSMQIVATTLLGSTALTGATVTTDKPLLDLSQTWNAAGVTFTGLRFNATDTASAAGSLLLDLEVGGAPRFSVNKSGEVATGLRIYPTSQSNIAVLFGNGTFSVERRDAGTTQFSVSATSKTVGLGATALFGWSGTTDNAAATQDTILRRAAAATLQLGAADAAAPVAQTLQVQSVVAGTPNTAGANFTINGSRGTGTGAGGSIIFQVAPAGASGTAQNAYATALTLNSVQQMVLENAGSASAPSITWSGSTSTGIFRSSASIIDFSLNGAATMRVATNGVYVSRANSPLQVSATGNFSFSSNVAGSDAADLILARDAANTLALRNGANAQRFNSYRSYTDASNYQRLSLHWNTSTALVMNEGAGTGADGSVAFNDAALATDATRGFIMIPSCAGAPTGTPADIPTGQIPLVWDSTNLKLYVYTGGAWKASAAFT